MIILQNSFYRAATLVSGVLLLVFVISYRDLFETTPESRVAAESVHLMGHSISRAMNETSFFQPIIALTVSIRDNSPGAKHRTLPVDEAVLYRRR